MRLVSVKNIEAGSLLARPVLSGRPDEPPLLSAGAVFSEGYRAALLRAGVFAVYIEDDLSDGIEVPRVLHEETRQQVSRVLAKTYDEIARIAQSGRTLSSESLVALEQAARLIASDVEACGDAAFSF